MRLALIASFLLVMAGRAAAQPGTVPPAAVPPAASSPVNPAPSPLPAAPAPPAPAEGDRDEDTAVALAVGGTLASWTTLLVAANTGHGQNAVAPLAAVSTLLAPSLGHWYAGTPFTGWLGLRAAVVAGGFYLASRCDVECDFTQVGYVALALYAIGTLGDIATAPADVRRHNEERRMLRDLAVVPMIQRGAGGIVLGARF